MVRMMTRGPSAVAGEDPAGGLQAVHLGHPDVHQDHVGPGAPDRLDRLGAVGRLGDHVDAVGGEDHPEAGADQGLVVGDDAPAAGSVTAPPGGSGPRPGSRRGRRRPVSQGPAVDGEALAQADQPAAVAGGGRRAGRAAGVGDLDPQLVAAVLDGDGRRSAPAACLTVLVSASWTTR